MLNVDVSSFVPSSPSYLTYIKLCTLVKRNESMAHTLHAKLKEPAADENKRGPRPQDLIRLYDIILQVRPGRWLLLGVCLSRCSSPSPPSACRVWLSCRPCRVWRMTTPSRRRCPSRLWSTRPTGELSSLDAQWHAGEELIVSAVVPQMFLHSPVLCAGEEVERGSGAV